VWIPFDTLNAEAFEKDSRSGKWRLQPSSLIDNGVVEKRYKVMLRDFVIVPPSFSKNYSLIRDTWRHAASELQDAEHIYFIGFSLPETDQFFAYLYALGTISRTRQRVICMANPDEDGKVEARLRKLVDGASAGRFTTIKSGFPLCLSSIRQKLQIPKGLRVL
jgi:hypothetical protein